ncbi:MAG: DUF1549 domain-containing protein [Planctomycetes bacterium]|nr:DUF1549 domain-containing protein [Planctomycetota bacterium]
MQLLRPAAVTCLAACAAMLWLAQATTRPASAAPVPEPKALSQRIDSEVEALWKRDNIKPAALSSDAEFVRRVYLDTLGVPPTGAQADAFLRDLSKDKRATLIETLLADPRFGQHLADLWMPILRERGNDLGELGVSAGDVMAAWLADQFNADVPFNQTITALVTAEGPISKNPASAYYALMGFPAPVPDAAGLTLKNFAGMQLQCAQCHDHPYETAWKQSTFRGVASFFTPIEVTADFYTQPIDPTLVTKDPLPRDMLQAYLKTPGIDADAINRVNDLLTYDAPQFPGDTPVKSRDGASWRRLMASWLTSTRNRTAMQYQVNRFWSFLFGSGLVNAVDDFNSLNTPSHPALLDALADDYAANGFRIKRLYRTILNSRTWQLSSAGVDPKALPWHFAASRPRPLTPEQFFGALFNMVEGQGFIKAFSRQTLNTYQKLSQFAALLELQRKQGQEPENAPKFNLALLQVYEKRLEAMGPLWQIRRGLSAQYAQLSSDDERVQSESLTGSVDQALTILNGEVTRRLGGSLNGSLVYAIMRDHEDAPHRISALFLAVLSRKPTEAEYTRLRAIVEDAANANEAYEDLFFALISTTEFATNH